MSIIGNKAFNIEFSVTCNSILHPAYIICSLLESILFWTIKKIYWLFTIVLKQNIDRSIFPLSPLRHPISEDEYTMSVCVLRENKNSNSEYIKRPRCRYDNARALLLYSPARQCRGVRASCLQEWSERLELGGRNGGLNIIFLYFSPCFVALIPNSAPRPWGPTHLLLFHLWLRGGWSIAGWNDSAGLAQLGLTYAPTESLTLSTALQYGQAVYQRNQILACVYVWLLSLTILPYTYTACLY